MFWKFPGFALITMLSSVLAHSRHGKYMRFGACGTWEYAPEVPCFRLYGFACDEGVGRTHNLTFYFCDEYGFLTRQADVGLIERNAFATFSCLRR